VDSELYVGRNVYTFDGEMVGTVKQLEADAPPTTEYLAIDRKRARDIAVPRSILRISDDRLVLPFGMTVVEGAPNVSPIGRTVTIEEKWILDSFYSLWTGVPVTRIQIVKGQHNKQKGKGVEMNEKAKQATDRAKTAADQIVDKAKVQGAELIERAKVKEAELRTKAKHEAAGLRTKAEEQAAELLSKTEKQAAELREKAKLEAADLLEKAKAQAADLSAKAKKDAKERATRIKGRIG
jgi:hypothetical protein